MIRKLCDAENLPAEGKLKAFVDTRPSSHMALCVGVLDGIPYAVDNVCPHQRAPLAAGRLEGDYVVCPIHEWKFKLTNGQPLHPGDPFIPSYEVRQYGDEVFVRIETDRPPGAKGSTAPPACAPKSSCALAPWSAIR